MMPQHVLVTGAAGFIGSHLVDHLLARGDRVTAVDTLDEDHSRQKRRNVARHQLSSAFRLVESDVRDAASLEARLPDSYDAIVHLAARVGAEASTHDALLYQDVNVGGTQVMLEFARRHRIPQFVFGSSGGVYATMAPGPCREDCALTAPVSAYASSKFSAERLGRAYSDRFGLRVLALRIFTVYGPRQRADMAVRKFATAILRGESISMHGDGASRRDYTYIDDVVSGLLSAIEYRGSQYETINIGSGRGTTLLEMVHTLAATLGLHARVERTVWPANAMPETCASLEKARRLLGYRPRTTLSEGIGRFFDWMKEASQAETSALRLGDTVASRVKTSLADTAIATTVIDERSVVPPATPLRSYWNGRTSVATTAVPARP